MHARRVAAIFLAGLSAAAALSALAASGAARSLDSGVRGKVTYGPTCPVQRVGQSCTRPYRATIDIRREPGDKLVATVRSSAGGHFSVRLAPGRYLLSPRAGHPFPHSSPQTVSVRSHRFTSVTISYDSGIR